MLFYMNEVNNFDYGVCIRGEINTYTFPCIHRSNGETYASLANEFYAAYQQFSEKTKIEALMKANRTLYVISLNGETINDLHPKVDFPPGEILIIPVLPPPN